LQRKVCPANFARYGIIYTSSDYRRKNGAMYTMSYEFDVTSSGSQQQQLEEIADGADELAGMYRVSQEDSEDTVRHIGETMAGEEGVEDMVALLRKVAKWAENKGNTLHKGHSYTAPHIPEFLASQHERVGELATKAAEVTRGTNNEAAEATVGNFEGATATGESALVASKRGLTQLSNAVGKLLHAAATIGEVVSELTQVNGILATAEEAFAQSGSHCEETAPQLDAAAENARTYAEAL
jgi:hypothetical protein